MKVLFLLDNSPVSSNFRGGASTLYEMYIQALQQLGVELYIWRSLNGPMGEETRVFERTVGQEHQQRLKASVAEWVDFEYHLIPSLHNRRRYVWVPQAILNPLKYTFMGYAAVQAAVGDYMDRIEPDLIWANHLVMGGIMSLLDRRRPWVYSHLDWRYRVLAVRAQHQGILRTTLRTQLLNWTGQQAEISVVRHATAAISGSVTEADDIRRLGTQAFYIPACYDLPVDDSAPVAEPEVPRIVHFGGMKSTANRVGLERYLDVVHQAVLDRAPVRPELWIVGTLEGAEARLVEKLQAVGAVCTGYVPDPATVFRPFDIAIIPYEHNTGTRTRVPMLLANRQVLVAVKETMRGFPEVTDGRDGILVDTLEHMRDALVTLISDAPRRKALGLAAGECFRNNFVLQAQMPKFEAVLSIARR